MGSAPSIAQQELSEESMQSINLPVHDTPILGMTTRPRVSAPVEYGNPTDFWVEYPNGLVDVSRATHLKTAGTGGEDVAPPPLASNQLDIPADGDRVVRVDKDKTALVVIDMQK